MTSSHFSSGFPSYAYGPNALNYIFVDDGDPFGELSQHKTEFEGVAVTLHYLPSPTVDFELDSNSSLDERKVLLYHALPSTTAFSSAQNRLPGSGHAHDARIEIRGRLVDALGRAVPFRPVYLKVADPPDTSAYVPVADRRAGDNLDAGGGHLVGEVSGGGYATLTDGNGEFAALLLTTHHVAGDNYRVQAGYDPTLLLPGTGCSPSVACAETATITAWKQFSVETDSMFRAGALIDATSDGTTVHLRRQPHVRFRAGQRVRLIHHPASDPAGSPGEFYAEDATIVDVARGTELTITPPLLHTYFPARAGDPVEDSDAVGILDDGEFRPNTQAVVPFFRESYVEYADAPFNAVMNLPFLPGMSYADAHLVAQTWFENDGAEDTQYLAGFERRNDRGSFGTTYDGITTLWIDEMERAVSGATQQASFNADRVCHELTHRWAANAEKTTLGDHCDLPAWDTSGGESSCLMNVIVQNEKNDVVPSYTNSILRFHYRPDPAGSKVPDSEYMRIRYAMEPLPRERSS